MESSAEFLLGLLDQDPAFVVGEDFDGPHGDAVRAWQSLGIVSSEPGAHPTPSCPRCGEGVPVRLAGRLLCNRCASRIDPGHLAAWSLDGEAFLRWLARGLGLRGTPRRHDRGLWQLGTWTGNGQACECFFLRGPLSEVDQTRLEAYRNAMLLYGLTRPAGAERIEQAASLLGVLRTDGARPVLDSEGLFRFGGAVVFDERSGALWVGATRIGEVPLGSREYHFLRCLTGRLDQVVSYADIKCEVQRHSGSRDGRDEATFCHNLKNRIKRKWIDRIDLLLVTTNRARGYRLRGQVEL